MNIPFLDLKVQYKQIEQELKPILNDIMANAAFIGGPQVSGLEEEFAAFCDSAYCVGVGSGTDALRFALMGPWRRPWGRSDYRTEYLYCNYRSCLTGGGQTGIR